MKKKTVSMGLALLLTASLLAGCGGGGGTDSGSSGSTADTSAAQDTADAAAPEDTAAADTGDAAADAGSGEQVTINFQTWNPGQGTPIDEVIAAFEAQNPDIKVNHVFMPYTDHVEKLKIDMASGEGADVFGMQTGATIKEFRDFEVDLTPLAEETWGAGWQDQYIDFCMDLLNEDGHYYGLPLGLTYAGYTWADVKMLKENGVAEIPKNYDDLKKAADTLRANGQYPLTIGAKDAWINIDTWMSIANDINPEKLYSAIEGETPFTDPDLVESFRIWQSCFTDGIFQDGALGVGVYNDTSDLFEKEGSIPMIQNGSWAAGVYVDSDPDHEVVFNSEDSDHDIFLMDWNNDGKPCPVSASVDVCLCINNNSKNQEAAWRFVDFLLHEGQDILVGKYLQYCPSRKDMVLAIPGMSEDGQANLDYIVEQAQTNIGGYREMAYADLKQVISDQLTVLALGDATPEDAAAAIEAASQAQAR
ncbi:MAG: ABC transporter substrate-binding protein [Clostridium sp.]|nr:ABC transporter substrate-binding protein [Clostridium sp.]